MKKGYYKADPLIGVYFYGEYLDEPETEVLTVSEFYDLLPTTGKEITTFIGPEDNEAFEAIEREYGIN